MDDRRSARPPRVLVTRAADRIGELATRLRDGGAEVTVQPTIRLVPPGDPGPARAAIARLDRYDWLFFTSVNGVRFFAERMRAEAAEPAFAARVAAVGPATAAALSGIGRAPTLVAADARAEGLVELLARYVRRGQRALVVRPEVGRSVLVDALERHGVQTDAVAFYRNVTAPGAADLALRVADDAFDVIVFGSPSGLWRLLEARPAEVERLRGALARAALVAIGPVTEQALRKAGLTPAAVARDPGEDALVEAVVSCYHHRPSNLRFPRPGGEI